MAGEGDFSVKVAVAVEEGNLPEVASMAQKEMERIRSLARTASDAGNEFDASAAFSAFNRALEASINAASKLGADVNTSGFESKLRTLFEDLSKQLAAGLGTAADSFRMPDFEKIRPKSGTTETRRPSSPRKTQEAEERVQGSTAPPRKDSRDSSGGYYDSANRYKRPNDRGVDVWAKESTRPPGTPAPEKPERPPRPVSKVREVEDEGGPKLTQRQKEAMKRVPDAERMGIPNASQLAMDPERMKSALSTFSQLRTGAVGRAPVDTKAANYSSVEEAATALTSLKQAATEAARAERELTRGGGRGGGGGGGAGGRSGDTRHLGFTHEALGAAVSGIGGYRSASRLPPGALGGSAASALGRGLGGGLSFNAFFALQNGLQNALGSAMALDKQMAELKDTVQGVTGSTSQFSTMRSDLLGISDATGVAGQDVTALAQSFLGLTGNVQAATNATEAAAKYIAVTGEAAATAGPQMATIQQNLGVGVQQQGNAAITAGRAVGRTPQDIQAGVAGVAPVASEYGLTANQTYGLVAATSKGSALSGADVGNQLDRILTALPEQLTALTKQGINFTQPANRLQDLKDLVSQINNPNVDKPDVINTLGGPKNAATLSALTNNPAALNLISGNYTNNNALNNRNASVQDSLAQSFARLRQNAESLAESLISSGIGQAFTDIVSAGGDVAGLFSTLAHYAGDVNNALGGVPAKLVEMAALIGTLNRVGAFQKVAGVASTAGNMTLTGLRQGGAVGAVEGLRALPGKILGNNPAQRKALRDAVAAAANDGEDITAPGAKQRIMDRVAGVGGYTRTPGVVSDATSAASSTQKKADTAAEKAETDAKIRNTAIVDEATTQLQLFATSVEEASVASKVGGLGGAGGAASTAEKDASKLGGAGGLAALGMSGPQAIAVGAAAAAYAVSSALAGQSAKAYGSKVGSATGDISNLTPEQMATVASGGTVRAGGKTISGTSSSVSSKQSTLGEGLALFGGSGGQLLNALGVGVTNSDSRRVMAQKQLRTSDYENAANIGKMNPGGVNDTAVQALVTAGTGNATQQKALTDALTAFQKSATAKNLGSLQSAFNALTKPGSQGRQVADNAVAGKAQAATLANLSQQQGVQFQTTGDVVSAFQTGAITFAQASQDLQTVVGSDKNLGVAGRQQKATDVAAQKQFFSDIATQNLSSQIAVGQTIGGQTPMDALSTTLAALNNSMLTPQAAFQVAQQGVSAQGAAAQYQLQNPDLFSAPGQSAESVFQQATTRGVAPISRDQAIAENARLTAMGAAPAYNITNASTYSAQLNPTQIQQAGQQLASTQTAQSGLQAAQAQQSGASPAQLAAIKTQGDQKALTTLQQADSIAKANATIDPAVIQAQTQLSQDQYAGFQAQLQQTQAIAQAHSAADFHDPLKQAQDIQQGVNNQLAQAHTSVGQLQAELDSGNISQQDLSLYNQAKQADQATYQAITADAQTKASYLQSLNAGNPLAAAQAAVSALSVDAGTAAAAAGGDPLAQARVTAANNAMASAVQAQIANVQGFYGAMAAGQAENPLTAAQTQLQGATQALATFAANYGADPNNSAYSALLSTVNQDKQQVNSAILSGLQTFYQMVVAQDNVSGNATQAAADQLQGANAALYTFATQYPAEANSNNANWNALLASQAQAEQAVFQAQLTSIQDYYQVLSSQETEMGNTTAAAQTQLQSANAQLQAYVSKFGANGSQEYQQLLATANQAAGQAFQAQISQITAVAGLASAKETMVGNSPAAAAATLRGAKSALQAFDSKFGKSQENSNNAEYVQLLTAYDQAQSEYLNTTISYGTNLLSEEVQNNQISIGQEINSLRALQAQAKAAGNNALVEQLQTQIQQAINQGNQNAQFNLPSNLNLPTLYEVRRTEATNAGATYNGNQGTVNVNINITNSQDTQSAVNALMAAVGGPPRTGISPVLP